MAWWHYENGNPAPWGEGRFDWTHLIPLLMILAAGFLSYIIYRS